MSKKNICLIRVPAKSPIESNQYRGNCTEKSTLGSQCNLICKHGYQEAALTSACILTANYTAEWSPSLTCIQDSCGVEDRNGYYKFPVNIKSIFSPTGFDDMINVYYVVFDSHRKLPIYTATYVSNISYIERLNRLSGFQPYTCIQLNRKQAKRWDFEMTEEQKQKMNKTCVKQKAWDRGHLSSQHFFRWSYKSAKTSNFFINYAPQDPWYDAVLTYFDV
jgi:DNA/RNA endonuclease G (NUC1)